MLIVCASEHEAKDIEAIKELKVATEDEEIAIHAVQNKRVATSCEEAMKWMM